MKQKLRKIAAPLFLAVSLLTSTLFAALPVFAVPSDSSNRDNEFILNPAPETTSPGNETSPESTENTENPTPADPSNRDSEFILNPDADTESDFVDLPNRDDEFILNPDDSSDRNGSDSSPADNTNENVCQSATSALSWIICSATQVVSGIVDSAYAAISNILVIKPIFNDHESTIYQVWDKIRELSNLAFVILLLIIIYSQFTGLGINNYGIKRTLPRIIIAIILVNLSYIICAAAVDLSNILGSSITGMFNEIQASIPISEEAAVFNDLTWEKVNASLSGGAALLAITSVAAGGFRTLFWMFAVALLGAAISVIIGLVTVSLRQGVVMVLVMIAPLAFIAYTLPNTEKWFAKWKDILFQMLFFYPMFSFLYGACKFIGWAIMHASNQEGLQVLLGLAIQFIPLVLSVSLLKMSSTVLGRISSGLDHLSSPIRQSTQGWANEHAVQSRERYIASRMPGAHLRRFLQNRQALRNLDTAENAEYNKNRALEHALNKQSSRYNRLESGHASWSARPNRYTSAAKRNALQKTRTATAQQNLANTLSEYGEIFNGRNVKRLSGAHAEAFKDNMMQEFWAENIAQSDQSFLLNSYINATKNRFRAPYEYNRLIRDAAGSSGHIGEASIMGQVIKKSVEIEGRRRTEASVMINKFNFKKGDFRGMVFDKYKIDDDGFEIGPDGKPIEDSQFRLLPGKTHREWDKFIYVNDRGNEIDPVAYNRLNSRERSAYHKVRYIDIFDDNGDVMQRVYEDDNGYMKEMLRNDIAIGDPINVRYASEIGVAHRKDELDEFTAKYSAREKSGHLRKYHSTISAAFREFGYAEHDASFTAMLQAQINNGYVTSMPQLNIARLESLTKAAKSGKLLQNDAVIIEYYQKLLTAIDSNIEGERFEDLFTDEAIALYRNVNGAGLKGLRAVKDADGKTIDWENVSRDEATLEEKRNYLKHVLIRDAAIKYLGSVNRDVSNSVSENQKSDATKAHVKLVRALRDVEEKYNQNPDLPLEERFSAHGENIFENFNPSIVRHEVEDGQRHLGVAPKQNNKKSNQQNQQNQQNQSNQQSQNQSSQSNQYSDNSNNSNSSSSQSTSGSAANQSNQSSSNQPHSANSQSRRYTGQSDPSSPRTNASNSYTDDNDDTDYTGTQNLNDNLNQGINEIHQLIADIRELSFQMNNYQSVVSHILSQCSENPFIGPGYMQNIQSLCSEYSRSKYTKQSDVTKNILDRDEQTRIQNLCSAVIALLEQIIGSN